MRQSAATVPAALQAGQRSIGLLFACMPLFDTLFHLGTYFPCLLGEMEAEMSRARLGAGGGGGNGTARRRLPLATLCI